MKHLVTGLISLCLSATVFTGSVFAEPITIKFSLIVDKDTPAGQGAALFQQLVSERLADQVEVEVYYNSELHTEATEMQALQANEVQMLVPSLSKLSAYTDQLKIFDLPFVFNDFNAVKKFWTKDVSTDLLGSMTEQGIVGLNFWGNGMKQITATKEIHAPADAEGLDFRVQNSPIIISQYQHIGVKPMVIAFSDSYDSLKNGTVQGTENTWSNIYTQNYQEVQPFMTETNHGVLAYMVITNTDFWWSLPFNVKVTLTSLLHQVSTFVNEESEGINAKAKAQLASSNETTIYSLSEQEKTLWRERYADFIEAQSTDIDPNIFRAVRLSN
jgi:C4-dicarboxylate-binding protein DctP